MLSILLFQYYVSLETITEATFKPYCQEHKILDISINKLFSIKILPMKRFCKLFKNKFYWVHLAHSRCSVRSLFISLSEKLPRELPNCATESQVPKTKPPADDLRLQSQEPKVHLKTGCLKLGRKKECYYTIGSCSHLQNRVSSSDTSSSALVPAP